MSLDVTQLRNLESTCQDVCKTLLKEKDKSRKRQDNCQNTSVTQSPQSLPFYSTILPIYQSLDYQECLLLEIEEQIKQRKNMLEAKKREYVSSNSTNSCNHHLQAWYQEMLAYHKEWLSHITDKRSLKEDCVFYNIQFIQSKSSKQETNIIDLSFSTHFCGRCLMLNISAKSDLSSEDFEILNCCSSLSFEGLFDALNAFLKSQRQAKEFVQEFLWKNIQTLIEYEQASCH